MLRASRAEVGLFEEVEHDDRATGQALVVILAVSIASGFGSGLGTLTSGDLARAITVLGVGAVAGLMSWALFAATIYVIGTRFFGADATWSETLRTLGFASTPLLLTVFGFVPFLGRAVVLVGVCWSIWLGFIAVRAALDISSLRTLATIILALGPPVALNAVLYQPAL